MDINLYYYLADGCYLDSGSHKSCVSKVDRSVSVEVAECAWWVGVEGRLLFKNFFQVERRSGTNIEKGLR